MSKSKTQALGWQNYTHLFGTGLTNPHDVIFSDTRVISKFGTKGAEIKQAYDIASTIPNWNMTWNGSANSGQFYGLYRDWVNSVIRSRQKSIENKIKQDEDILKKINKLNKLIQNVEISYNDALINSRNTYIGDNCFEVDKKNKLWKCKDDGFKNPTPADLKKNDKILQKVITDLENNQLREIDVLEKDVHEYFAIALNDGKYATLIKVAKILAIVDAAVADGDNASASTALYAKLYTETSDDSTSAPIAPVINPTQEDISRYTMDMPVGNKGQVTRVPIYTIDSGSVASYQTWLAKQSAQAHSSAGLLFADKAPYKTTISDGQVEKSGESWKYSAHGGFPIDFFWLGGGSSGSHSSYSESGKKYTLDFSLQSYTTVSIEPGDWFNEAIIDEYKNETLNGKPITGPEGILNIRVTGVIVGFAPYMKFTSDEWQTTNSHTQWAAEASFGIGPFNFESASASGSNFHSFTTELKDGLEVKDTSGEAVILGLITNTPGYDGKDT